MIHSIHSQLNASRLPALEARLLMMHVLKKTRIQLITESDYLLSEHELHTYQQLQQRRLQSEPIAYLISQREFFGLNLEVTPDVLIPRPETELLVELALRYAPPTTSLLDLGTGSGAIAIALAQQRPDLRVWATDISSAALEVARHNAQTHRCAIRFIESDWYSQLPHRSEEMTHTDPPSPLPQSESFPQQWRTIVSNPPYIAQHDPHLSQGDLRFEPIHALTDHADGLSAYRHIISGAPARLALGGWLLLEHGYDQAAAVRQLLAAHSFIQIQSWRDLAGIERVSGGRVP
jgi:release factor glutamine methyltransferase